MPMKSVGHTAMPMTIVVLRHYSFNAHEKVGFVQQCSIMKKLDYSNAHEKVGLQLMPMKEFLFHRPRGRDESSIRN